MKFEFTKDWCIQMARLEDDAAIGSGQFAFDPIPYTASNMDFVVEFLALAAGGDVPDHVKATAREELQRLGQHTHGLTLFDAVEAFAQIPALQALAARLRQLTLPSTFPSSAKTKVLDSGEDGSCILRTHLVRFRVTNTKLDYLTILMSLYSFNYNCLEKHHPIMDFSGQVKTGE